MKLEPTDESMPRKAPYSRSASAAPKAKSKGKGKGKGGKGRGRYDSDGKAPAVTPAGEGYGNVCLECVSGIQNVNVLWCVQVSSLNACKFITLISP